jgi:NitT/TauT family transport system substrate-binding protein
MKRMKRRIFALSFCIAATAIVIVWLALRSRTSNLSGLEKVTLVLNWTPNGTHAAYYAALKEGYFRDQGLDVEILEGAGSGTTVKVIGAGREEFGLAGAESAAIGRSRGIPIVSIAAIYQKSAVAFLTLESSGIKEFKDLIGRTMGVKFGSSTYPFYEATLKQLSIDRSRIKEVSIGPGVEPLIAGKIDAMDGQIDNEGVQIRERGFPVRAILYDDIGVKTYGITLLVHENTITERPKTVSKFLRAVLEGWKFTLANPDKAAEAVCDMNPTLDKKIVVAQTRAAIDLISSPDSIANGLGWQTAEGWRTTIETLTEMGQVTSKLAIDGLFTIDFLKDAEKVEVTKDRR